MHACHFNPKGHSCNGAVVRAPALGGVYAISRADFDVGGPMC